MSSNRDAVTVFVRVRPPDSETRQYHGGLSVQERRAQIARGLHDDPHDVVSLTCGTLEGRRVPSATVQQQGYFAPDGKKSDGRYNIVTVQQMKITVPSSSSSSSSTFVLGERQQQQRRGSAAAAAAADNKLTRSSSAKVSGGTRLDFATSTPEKIIAREQQRHLHSDIFSVSAPVRCARHVFEFDACFCSNPEHPAFADQARMFSVVGKPAVDHALKGFNVTCLLYGTTGAGKTHTMFGAHKNSDFPQIQLAQQQQQQQQQTGFLGGKSAKQQQQPVPLSVRQQQIQAQQHMLFEERGLVFRVAESLCNKMSQIRRANSQRAKSRSISLQPQQHNINHHNNNNMLHHHHHASEEPEPRRPSLSISDQQQQHHNVMTVTVSFFEIYCDKIWCLLSPAGNESLRVREHKTQGPFVEGLHEVPVTTVEDVYRVVERGSANRHFASTLHNHHSSRSHALLLFHIHQKQRANFSAGDHTSTSSSAPAASAATATAAASVFLSSKLYLVDLAGSERVSPHDEAETTHRSEAKYINSSLSVLGKVITALAQVPALARKRIALSGGGGASSSSKAASGGVGARRRTQTPAATGSSSSHQQHYVPYRDSVFTRLLRDSFGGNSKTFMVAAVSPEVKDLEETISTLRYASRARFIQNRPQVNSALQTEDRDRDIIIESLARRVEELEAQLSAAQTSATAAQLSAAAAALAQGLYQHHEHAAAAASASVSSAPSPSSSSVPSTRATSSQQLPPSSSFATTVQVGAVRWSNAATQQPQQQQNPPISARSTATSTAPSHSAEFFSSASSHNNHRYHHIGGNSNSDNMALYQELLSRSSQQQAMLQRIEEREALLLRILTSTSGGMDEAMLLFSPPQLMRGPTQTPGPAKRLANQHAAAAVLLRDNEPSAVVHGTQGQAGPSSSASEASKQLVFSSSSLSLSSDQQNQQHHQYVKPALRDSNSRSASANSNNQRTTRFAKQEGTLNIDKENERKFAAHVLHHHVPPATAPFERHNNNNNSMMMIAGRNSVNHLVKTPTRARSSTTSTIAGSPEGVMVQAAAGGKSPSPSATPPPNAMPIHVVVVGGGSALSAVCGAPPLKGHAKPAATIPVPQYRSNTPRAFLSSSVTTVAETKQAPAATVVASSSSSPSDPLAETNNSMHDDAVVVASAAAVVDEKRAALLARAEALRKRKAELAEKWSEMQNA